MTGVAFGQRASTDQEKKKTKTGTQTRKKASTKNGGAQPKLIAALITHHRYANGSCLNWEPIGNNALAKAAKVAGSTANVFFDEKFGGPDKSKGHDKYRALCRDDAGSLIAALKLLNGEFSPHHLFGRRPPDEDDRNDE